VDTLTIAVSKTAMRIVALQCLSNQKHKSICMTLPYPCEDPALSEQAVIHLLPTNAVMLNHWLIRNPESTPGHEAPVCGVKSYRRLLERFARAAECQETTRWQVREDKNQDVKREVRDRREFFCHFDTVAAGQESFQVASKSIKVRPLKCRL
jgi:hypothetical protein